jgi:hypothetical protein
LTEWSRTLGATALVIKLPVLVELG